jgi:endonuclease YncB( thermonuclease family)
MRKSRHKKFNPESNFRVRIQWYGIQASRVELIIASLIFAGAIIVASVFIWIAFRNTMHGTNPAASTQWAQAAKVTPRDTPPRTMAEAVGADDYLHWTTLRPAYQTYRFELMPDGSLQSDHQTYRLFGISMPRRSQVCRYKDGEPWACGQRAYIALLNLIGSTTVECRPRGAPQAKFLVCRVVTIDVSEWMLRNGWAYLRKNVTDQRYVDAANNAIAYKTGMWAQRPE